MIKDYFLLAFRNIRKRGLRSWLTMIGIFIGIAAVVSLIGLGEGLRTAVNSQFNVLGTNYIAVLASGGFGPPGTGVVNPLTNKELDRIKTITGVEGVAGRLIDSTRIEFNKQLSFGYASSIPYGEGRKFVEEAINLKAEKGRLLVDSDTNSVVLGNSFSTNDKLFGKTISPGNKIIVQGKEFSVVGIMNKKGNFQLDQIVLLNENEYRDLFNRTKDTYDLIAVKFNKNADVNQVKTDIEKAVRKVRNEKEGEEDFSVTTPQSIIQGVNNVLLGIQIFIYIIAGISLLVGGIGIMNTMYTAVVERTKEIGIMKSIGAKNGAIFSLFFIESGILGSVGGFVGATIGSMLAISVAYVGKLVLGSALIAANITPMLFFGAILFSFVLGTFFGTLPALSAAKLNPVDALRKIK